MKVAVIVDTWFPFIGGGQINAWETSKRLAKKGIAVDIITRNNGRDNHHKIKNLNVYKLGAISGPNNVITKIVFIARSYLFIANRNYCLVHAHAFLPGITGKLLFIFKRVPVIFSVHGTSIGTNLNSPIIEYIERIILTKIKYSAQITVSKDFLNIKNLNDKIYYIPNGVDLKSFDKIKTNKYKNPTLIFVGRLHPQKNLGTLIDAMSQASKLIPDINLLIVGKGQDEKLLKEKVKKLKLQHHIQFAGEVLGNELIKLYKSSHAFILPSIYEGQPISLLEAWAAKLPAIVSKTGDCQYLVKNKINGYFIRNQNDPANITETITEAFKDKNLSAIGNKGYSFVKNHLTWEKSAIETIKVYEKVRNV